ncbi:Hypothetical protein LBF_2159 [Leptospira biflexa serovar Patoc strain 'Patoc 1 (Ames)']|uniref:Uncharacterized protein n=1 Tax=Leptospira biflexa serovar Patoc (strain Patoc 1 / ATCC 23582 / Paris) TaxID=456481 RepID=B0ST79_LEPBP|nr:Hypothetical protein LBF_2159 [Leptospira biflexa serovar Patoc strain 'Patoc 1 (Ames)']ABZ98319.1 Hypothetical protein LEPBI_I2221 [Leptospira biflexa serovar Patoc strain 'Patoc 1 (Paris)']
MQFIYNFLKVHIKFLKIVFCIIILSFFGCDYARIFVQKLTFENSITIRCFEESILNISSLTLDNNYREEKGNNTLYFIIEFNELKSRASFSDNVLELSTISKINEELKCAEIKEIIRINKLIEHNIILNCKNKILKSEYNNDDCFN